MHRKTKDVGSPLISSEMGAAKEISNRHKPFKRFRVI
jgi:hypothetical protein